MSISSRLLPLRPRIAVNFAGSGEAVVFLHGAGTTKASWNAQLAFFRRTHFAAAWDARGYGDSDDHEGEFDFAADFTGDLRGVLDSFDIESAHIIGLSMGGLIAQCFYFAHPNRVATLILAHTFPSFGALGEEFVAQFVSNRLQPLIDGGSPADTAADTVEGLLAPGAPRSAKDHFFKSLCELRKDPYVRTLRGLVAEDAPGALEDIRVPTLVLAGEHDRLSPPALSRQMSERIPASQVAVISGCGHLSNIERPVEFNSLAHEFISSHTGAATNLTVV